MAFTIGKKSLQQLNRETKDDIVALTNLDTIQDNSTLDGLITSSNRRLAEAYDVIESNFIAGYLRTATGPYLDALAADRGLTRQFFTTTNITCTAQTLVLRTNDGTTLFSALNVTGSFKVLPRGLRITSSIDPTIVMFTNETITITPQMKSVFIGAEGQFNDDQVITAGTFDTLDYSSATLFDSANLARIEFVQSKDVIGIERAETDDSLRVRTSQWSTAAAAGNESAISGSVFSHPEIASVLIDRNVRGTGSADIIAFPRFNRISQAVLDQIESQVIRQKSFGEDIRVIPPDYVQLSMILSVPSTVNRSTVVVSVENFVENTTNKSISYNILKRFLKGAGIEVTIRRLTVDGQDLLPDATVSLLSTEIFELSPRISSEKAVDVILE